MGLLRSFYAACSSVYQQVKPSPVRAEERVIHELLQPGDIVTLRGVLTERMWPGWWSHVGMCVARERGTPMMLEARIQHGVRAVSLSKFLTGTWAAVLRPNVPKHAIAQAVARARALTGEEFDLWLDFSDESKVICTELILRAYRGIVPIHMDSVLGRKVVLTDSFFRSSFDVVYASEGAHLFGKEVQKSLL